MTKAEVVELLRAAIDQSGSGRKWSAEHGVKQPEVSRTLNGQIDPPPSILAALGVERVITYRKINP